MKLKHWVKVENGMVYEIESKVEYGKLSDVCIDNVPVVATSDDIFELAQDGWFALVDGWTVPMPIFGIEESVGGGHYIEIYATDEVFYDADGDILTLFAPITENGSVVRYELVWERESK